MRQCNPGQLFFSTHKTSFSCWSCTCHVSRTTTMDWQCAMQFSFENRTQNRMTAKSLMLTIIAAMQRVFWYWYDSIAVLDASDRTGYVHIARFSCPSKIKLRSQFIFACGWCSSDCDYGGRMLQHHNMYVSYATRICDSVCRSIHMFQWLGFCIRCCWCLVSVIVIRKFRTDHNVWTLMAMRKVADSFVWAARRQRPLSLVSACQMLSGSARKINKHSLLRFEHIDR